MCLARIGQNPAGSKRGRPGLQTNASATSTEAKIVCLPAYRWENANIEFVFHRERAFGGRYRTKGVDGWTILYIITCRQTHCADGPQAGQTRLNFCGIGQTGMGITRFGPQKTVPGVNSNIVRCNTQHRLFRGSRSGPLVATNRRYKLSSPRHWYANLGFSI